MSRTKEYIDQLMEQGVDIHDNEYDAEYLEYLEEQYQKSLKEMNQYFNEHAEEIETETPKSE